MPSTPQAHRLTGEKLKMREVVTIDIANDAVKSADYKADEDPTKFKSEKTGRGPLQEPQWWKKVRHLTSSQQMLISIKEECVAGKCDENRRVFNRLGFVRNRNPVLQGS